MVGRLKPAGALLSTVDLGNHWWRNRTGLPPVTSDVRRVVRSLLDQCAAAGLPFHHKQNEWIGHFEAMKQMIGKGPDVGCVGNVQTGAKVVKVGNIDPVAISTA